MDLREWVRQQMRGRLHRAMRGQEYFDYQMFWIWATVSTQAGFSIWDLVIEMASDSTITRFLKQVMEKYAHE